MNAVPSGELRKLPSVSRCLESDAGKRFQAEFGSGITAMLARRLLDRCRGALMSGQLIEAPSLERVLNTLEVSLVREATPDGRRAINATGILLHTGLGRSPLSRSAVGSLSVMERYSILEVDIETGERSRRDRRVEELVKELAGCEAATVVNNNAAATFITLNTIAKDREVIISRGQMIEIGGSYRMPDVMAQSGVILKEVGTTNRTHLRDYERAIGPNTGAIIHVHTSNYRIQGFTSTPDIAELCVLGKDRGIPVIDDLGSGALTSLQPFGLPDQALVANSVKAGAAATCFSGDKLISGPQAGLIVGAKDFIHRIRENPFFRMFRVDKLCLAALEATLIHLINGGDDLLSIPLYEMLSKKPAELWMRAEKLLSLLNLSDPVTATIQDDSSYLGGGTLPDEALPTVVLRIEGLARPNRFADSLRNGIPAVFCRVHDNNVLFDLRTIFEDEIPELARRLNDTLYG